MKTRLEKIMQCYSRHLNFGMYNVLDPSDSERAKRVCEKLNREEDCTEEHTMEQENKRNIVQKVEVTDSNGKKMIDHSVAIALAKKAYFLPEYCVLVSDAIAQSVFKKAQKTDSEHLNVKVTMQYENWTMVIYSDILTGKRPQFKTYHEAWRMGEHEKQYRTCVNVTRSQVRTWKPSKSILEDLNR